jgi:hypothetical protein
MEPSVVRFLPQITPDPSLAAVFAPGCFIPVNGAGARPINLERLKSHDPNPTFTVSKNGSDPTTTPQGYL